MVVSEEKLYEKVFSKKKRSDSLNFKTDLLEFVGSDVMHPTSPFELVFSDILEGISRIKSESPVERRVTRLEKEVSELKLLLNPRQKATRADKVYERFRETLERDHFGKIVAIDTTSEKVVGYGDTILEAFREAESETGKKRFSYRKVGYSYVYKL